VKILIVRHLLNIYFLLSFSYHVADLRTNHNNGRSLSCNKTPLSRSGRTRIILIRQTTIFNRLQKRRRFSICLYFFLLLLLLLSFHDNFTRFRPNLMVFFFQSKDSLSRRSHTNLVKTESLGIKVNPTEKFVIN